MSLLYARNHAQLNIVVNKTDKTPYQKVYITGEEITNKRILSISCRMTIKNYGEMKRGWEWERAAQLKIRCHERCHEDGAVRAHSEGSAGGAECFPEEAFQARGKQMPRPCHGNCFQGSRQGWVLGRKRWGRLGGHRWETGRKSEEGRGPRTLAFPRVRWKPQVAGGPDIV